MRYTLPRVKISPAPVHIVQYRSSPHAYGLEFTTRATTTRGIAIAAARAAREDAAYWSNNRKAAPVVVMIDGLFLLPRDWQDPEIWQLCDLIDREASKPRPPKMHEGADRPSTYGF